jgi:hypothetical protein
LGGGFVVDFSSRSEELTKRHARCHALDSLLEVYRGEGGEMGANTGTLA